MRGAGAARTLQGKKGSATMEEAFHSRTWGHTYRGMDVDGAWGSSTPKIERDLPPRTACQGRGMDGFDVADDSECMAARGRVEMEDWDDSLREA